MWLGFRWSNPLAGPWKGHRLQPPITPLSTPGSSTLPAQVDGPICSFKEAAQLHVMVAATLMRSVWTWTLCGTMVLPFDVFKRSRLNTLHALRKPLCTGPYRRVWQRLCFWLCRLPPSGAVSFHASRKRGHAVRHRDEVMPPFTKDPCRRVMQRQAIARKHAFAW